MQQTGFSFDTTNRLQQLVDDGALFYCSHSGGKDSQAMYSYLMANVPANQIIVVHADLGTVEWTGVQTHIRNNITHELNVVHAIWKDGGDKGLLGMVEKRFADRPDVPSWPSSATRQCTSDLKRGPLQKFIRNDMKGRGKLLAVNCMGLRAEESSSRAKLPEWRDNKDLSKAGRTVYDWLPIHDWSTVEVFQYISDAGQKPFWAYEAGNQRLSCVFCIMGSANDIENGRRARPELFWEYVRLERKTGYTMFAKQSLLQRAGIIATDA
jgi:DNA sulfur modification protein DndC